MQISIDSIKSIKESHSEMFEHNTVKVMTEHFCNDVIDTSDYSVHDVIGVWYNIEIAQSLVNQGYKNVTLITNEHDKGTQLLTNSPEFGIGASYKTIDEVEGMKFDKMPGNPPWNKNLEGVSGYFYKHALTKALEEQLVDGGELKFILSANLLTAPSLKQFRDYLLTYNVTQLEIYDNSKNQVFDITNQHVLIITIKKEAYQGTTKVVREIAGKVSSTQVDLTKYDHWPMYQDDIAKNIIHKVLDKSQGYLRVNPKVKYEPVASDNYVSFPILVHDMSPYKVNNTDNYYVNDNHSVSDIGRFFFDTKAEADLYLEFMKSPVYGLVHSSLKTMQKVQEKQMMIIGYQNFADNDFNKHFGFTTDEIEYLESISE